MKRISISKYFQIINPEYSVYKITPDTSIRNYNSSIIAKAIASTYRTLTQHISKTEHTWKVERPSKVSFMIDITKEETCFYFIIPEAYSSLLKEKIINVWSKVTIEEVRDIKPFTDQAQKYYLQYKSEDALSLNLDRKCNEPLNSILNVIDILQETDRIAVFYNFIPCSQMVWREKYNKTINKIKNNEFIDKEVLSFDYMFKSLFILLKNVTEGVFEAVGGLLDIKPESQNKGQLEAAITKLMINDNKRIGKATLDKKDAQIINTQLIVMSESLDNKRKSNNANSVVQAFKTLTEDNELIAKKLKGEVDYFKYSISKAEINKMSVDECQNFLEIPGKELLTKYKCISKIDVLQSEVPKQISNGIIRAGGNIYKGNSTEVYHTEDKELKNTAICICGPNRSGKSTLLANMVKDMINNGRTVILPDFCGKCQLSNELAEVIPAEKILNINCNDWDTLQGFQYNEIIPKDNSIFELYNCAKIKASKLKELINLVNDGESDLEGRMERYLEYAALVVFVCNGSVNDVFKMLKDHRLRHQFINTIPEALKEPMEEYIQELLEIDEVGTKKENMGLIIGTKQGHISAILSRVHRLKENAYIEMMLKKESVNNINLLDEMQKGKLICIRMYDSMFATQEQKDIYVCYWLTKAWGALQKRFCDLPQEELRQVVLLIDELYQVKNGEKYLTMILSQMPKYRSKLILSCHHLGQIPVIQEELKSAMCSYMFIAGSNKKNFQAMKEEFEDKGYSLEDLLHLKRHESLNLLAYEEGYWCGITKLPKPI